MHPVPQYARGLRREHGEGGGTCCTSSTRSWMTGSSRPRSATPSSSYRSSTSFRRYLSSRFIRSWRGTRTRSRPTTSKPTAAIWGDSDASELLDWLRIDVRHGAEPGGPGAPIAGSLDGLVLLDLPDFDSRELSHRQEAERVLELVDVFVWVTDPQKYADARLHDEFVSLMSHHDAVTLGVLNQSDRLPSAAVETIAADLARLLAADGVRDAKVITTSTVTGTGLALVTI